MSHESNEDNNEDISWFDPVKEVPIHEFYFLEEQFKEDEYSYKLDFTFSCYRDENGKACTLQVVSAAERTLAHDKSLTKEYIHPFGYESFNSLATKLLLGPHSLSRIENRVFTIQSVSAHAALRLGAEFLIECLGMTTVYSTKENMEYIDTVFLRAGFKEYNTLRYFNHYTVNLDINGLLQDLENAKKGSVVFLQICGHNPTGCDPTMDDWEKIADIMEARKLFPFLFSLYQGLVSGDTDQDAAAVRMFEKRGFEFFCAQSFSWNFSLYSERVGDLVVVMNDKNKMVSIKSNFLHIARNLYGTPPGHGARIVALILSDMILTEQWKEALRISANRIQQMRMCLREELERLGAPGRWNHITDQVGQFCFTGLSEIQVEHMKKQFHIYMPSNGRLNISGLNLHNVEYVAKAINQTLCMLPHNNIMTALM